jgi:hypothetical protein
LFENTSISRKFDQPIKKLINIEIFENIQNKNFKGNLLCPKNHRDVFEQEYS